MMFNMLIFPALDSEIFTGRESNGISRGRLICASFCRRNWVESIDSKLFKVNVCCIIYEKNHL